MAKKTEEQNEGVLTAAAKSVGKAAGKIAATVVSGGSAPPKPATKLEKLQKKNKSRLPRKQKKALAKESTRTSAP